MGHTQLRMLGVDLSFTICVSQGDCQLSTIANRKYTSSTVLVNFVVQQAVHKLRALPDDLYDYLSLEAVMTSAQASTASSHNDRIWRQFKVCAKQIGVMLVVTSQHPDEHLRFFVVAGQLTPALCDEALRYFPTLNVSAVVSLLPLLRCLVLVTQHRLFHAGGFVMCHCSLYCFCAISSTFCESGLRMVWRLY